MSKKSKRPTPEQCRLQYDDWEAERQAANAEKIRRFDAARAPYAVPELRHLDWKR